MSKQQTLGYKGQLFMLDLSYIGWLLLASLTSVVQTGYIYACIFQDPGYYLANPAQVYAITLPMPVGLQVVLGCVWPLLVALFYLPVYQCTELGYFDTAKHTSGVGEGAAPKDPGSFDSGWGASERPIKPTSPRRVLEPAGGLSFRRPRLRAGPGALRHPASFRGPPPRQGPPSTSIFQILPQTQSSPAGLWPAGGAFFHVAGITAGGTPAGRRRCGPEPPPAVWRRRCRRQPAPDCWGYLPRHQPRSPAAGRRTASSPPPWAALP